MKKTFVFALLVVIMVLSMSGVAMATRYDSSYYDPTAWVTAFPGVSPHGQYAINTTKCNVCHAVHNPGDTSVAVAEDNPSRLYTSVGSRVENLGSEYLLRSSAADSCNYCHVSNNFAIKTVYAEDPANWNDGSTAVVRDAGEAAAHNGGVSDGGWATFGCTNCHQVHAALDVVVAEDSYLASKMLVKESGAFIDEDAPAYALEANGTRDAATLANETRWCTRCHEYYNSTVYGDGQHPDTHVLKGVGGAGYVASTYCESCHDNGLKDQAAATNGVNNYPHFTTGARFLNVADDADSSGLAPATANAARNFQVDTDGVCVKCHLSGTGDGIGLDH